LTASTVNGSGNGAHTGAQTLALLADPLNVFVLRALSTGPKRQVELRHESGSPAQSTLRAHLKRLEAIGAISKRRPNAFPGTLEYELAGPGTELLFVAAILERWLAGAPDGPIELGRDAARAATRALVDGWTTTIMRALAARPLSLTELDRVIAALNYPSLERRLGAMRLAGQIEARPANGRATPYGVTEWLRRGVAPLAAAARWERRHLPHAATAITRIDVEAALLLAVPLLRLDPDLSGSCRLAVEISEGRRHSLAGVMVDVSLGRIASCATRLEGFPDAWICGPPAAWLAALIDGDTASLELGGDGSLARSLLHGLHRALFEARVEQR